MHIVPDDIPDSIVSEYRRAFRFVEEQRYSEAKSILKACVESCPKFVVARKEYALVLRKLGELDAALAERQAIKNMAPTDEATRLELVTLLSVRDRYEEALAEAVELRKMHPLNISYRSMVRKLARLCKKGHFSVVPSGMLELIPRMAACRMSLIDLLSKRMYLEALTLTEDLLRQCPSDENVRRLIAKLRNLVQHGQIFISYRSSNANAVRSVVEMLLRNDFAVWFAEYHVLSVNYDCFDAEVEQNLKVALSKCRTAIVFANDEWANSDYCRSEIRYISENLDRSRIVQICVPRQDSRPAEDWAILRDVPTYTCAFADPGGIQQLYSWLLDQLTVELGNRYPSVWPCDLGNPVQVTDSYRGGTVAELRVGQFMRVNTPFWYSLTAPADLESMLLGCPSATFKWRSDVLYGHCSLIVDFRVNRWTGMPGSYNLDNVDDRKLYHHLRNMARGGYERHMNTLEGGLHLFRYQGRGQLAITFRTPVMLGYYFWKRIYVLIVQNKVDGTYGEVNLDFSRRFSNKTPEEFAFREFCAFLPLFDGIAGSLKYDGYQSRKVLLRVQLGWVLAGAVCALLLAILVHRLLSVPGGAVGLVVAMIAGGIIGIVLNHRLMVVSQGRSD
jgi:tetratricopeptide (TPR) repeat protein